MYDETKKAIIKAFDIGRVLFSLGNDYNKLLNATKEIKAPLIEELEISGSIEDAIFNELKNRYVKTALKIGLKEKHGIAMFEYAILLKAIN
jgi:hypothetical protein